MKDSSNSNSEEVDYEEWNKKRADSERRKFRKYQMIAFSILIIGTVSLFFTEKYFLIFYSMVVGGTYGVLFSSSGAKLPKKKSNVIIYITIISLIVSIVCFGLS